MLKILKIEGQCIKNPIEKNGKETCTYNSQWPTGKWKICSSSVIIREIQNKTPVSYPFSPIRMVKTR